MSKRMASANSSSSRFAEPSHTTTLSPDRIARPPSSMSTVAVLRFMGDGVVHRNISSIAVPSNAGIAAHAVPTHQDVGSTRAGHLPRRCGWCPPRREEEGEEGVQLAIGETRRIDVR